MFLKQQIKKFVKSKTDISKKTVMLIADEGLLVILGLKDPQEQQKLRVILVQLLLQQPLKQQVQSAQTL